MAMVFVLGFLLGLQHAMEGDHLAAVAAIARDTSSRAKAIAQGCAWGLGHTLALLVLVIAVTLTGLSISEGMSHWLEFGVGILLIALGLHAIRTARKRRIHIHLHQHEDGRVHIHAHRHSADAPTRHDHSHRFALASRTTIVPLAVGLVHGVAGTAALVVILAATSVTTLWQAVAYVALFGVGSMIGMAAMTLAFSVPVGWVQRRMPQGEFAFSVLIGVVVISVGLYRCLISIPA